MAFARKQKKMTNISSIDVAAKMADVLGVTLYYFVQNEYDHIDNEIIQTAERGAGTGWRYLHRVFATIDAES